MPTQRNPALDAALAEAFRHVRDVSVRDGVQSWDANLWPIADIIPVVKQINQLAVTVENELGAKMQPVEVWGGGQVMQPAKFLREDPIMNLADIKKAAPDLELQCLYRGRQCFGFTPVSVAVQKEAIKVAAENGVNTFRVFDMMNDMDNMLPGINALKEYRANHTDKKITIEGAISYISEPHEPRAWTLEEYGALAGKLAKAGVDEIAIKDFAGVGNKEMPDLIAAVRKGLTEAGFRDMPINLHSHGQKPDVLFAALKQKDGVDKVDVAIGELAGGPSHTNIRDIIAKYLAEKGFNDMNAAEVREHPVMQQLAEVEKTISEIVHSPTREVKGSPGKTQSFDDRRALLKNLDQDRIEKYRMAGGAFSDISTRVDGFYSVYTPGIIAKGGKVPEKAELFEMILEKGMELWEKGGRFNTVTPGAKIIVDQAWGFVVKKLQGKEISMNDYDDAYLNAVTGRFGANQGMDKGIGDQKFRDAALMFRALKHFNDAMLEGDIGELELMTLAKRAHIGGPAGKTQRVRLSFNQKDHCIQMNDPNLERVLMDTDIKEFHNALAGGGEFSEPAMRLPEELRKKMLAELKPGRSPDPTAGLDEGQKIVAEVARLKGHNAVTLHQDGKRITEHSPLLALLLQEKGNGHSNESFANVVAQAAKGIPFSPAAAQYINGANGAGHGAAPKVALS